MEVSALLQHIILPHDYRSGNGLVSYYINLVLEGVGITSTRTKAAINGALQVSGQNHQMNRSIYIGRQCWNLASAMTGAFLVDWVGRRPLFIMSTAGMLIGMCMYIFMQTF